MSNVTERSWFRLRFGIWVVCLATIASGGRAEAPPGLIPMPASVQTREGRFRWTTNTVVAAEGLAAREGAKLIDALAPALGFRPLTVGSPPARDGIALSIDIGLRERLGEEGYELDVRSESVVLRAPTSAGLFYGIQTMRQLLPAAVYGSAPARSEVWELPGVRIVDSPRFGWRGLLVDPARHFIPVPDLERYLDVMALHKFNRLQIHLTDDQGWRVEIRKHPDLVRLGSVMDFGALRRGNGAPVEGAGGFYTQDDIRRLVRYAAERYITLVPEIEMPAHTGAALVAYPRLALYPDKLAALPPEKRWTAHEGVLAPRPETVAFFQDVLAEVAELFPGPYIHIGGDEANIDHWKRSTEMQAFVRDHDLKDAAGLHSWFVRRMDDFLTARGRRLIGWDEILQGGLAPGAVVMSWRGEEGGIAAARAGHSVIMAPTSHTYFDYYQGPAEAEPVAIGGLVPLEKVFRYEPVPEALRLDQAKYVLGAQAQLWGEFIPTAEHRFYMTYPRACALADVLWSPQGPRDDPDFLRRLAVHAERLRQLQVRFRAW